MTSIVVEVKDLYKYFPAGPSLWGTGTRMVKAVDGVAFQVPAGQTLGLVGESGCGKSTVASLLLRLVRPDRGDILFRGRSLLKLKGRELGQVRPRLQAVFQDPQSSLDPRMTVRTIVGYPLWVNRLVSRRAADEPVRSMLEEVGLAEEHLHRYPHELSGGQKQRVGIARALITEPDFVVFDEPTSALDVSVQAQILNLIARLQKKNGYAFLFISHDLAVVRHISHQVAVMYLGTLVEYAPKTALFGRPAHPYTRALLASAPQPDPGRKTSLAVLQGDPPSPIGTPAGCRFHPRCPEAMPVCRSLPPARYPVGEGHWVDCHLYR